jgi:hypothetical protein
MAMPFCGFTWVIYVPFNLMFLFFNLDVGGMIMGFIINLALSAITWLVWKYVVPMLSVLPVAGTLLSAIQPAVTLTFKVWTIILLIAGPILILMCQ